MVCDCFLLITTHWAFGPFIWLYPVQSYVCVFSDVCLVLNSKLMACFRLLSVFMGSFMFEVVMRCKTALPVFLNVLSFSRRTCNNPVFWRKKILSQGSHKNTHTHTETAQQINNTKKKKKIDENLNTSLFFASTLYEMLERLFFYLC